MEIKLYFPRSDIDPSYTGNNAYVFSVATETSLAWAINAQKSFSYTITPSAIISKENTTLYQAIVDRLNSVHGLPCRISIGSTDGSANFMMTTFYTISNLHYLNKYYLQSIKFDIDRYPNDESTGLSTTMKVGIASEAANYKSNFTVKVYYAKDATATTSSSSPTTNIDKNTLFGTGYSKNATIISGSYSTGSYYNFLLVVTDGMESISARCTVSRAFANVHFAGCSTGGVAFGRFSSSTENNPKFECEYPTYFSQPVFLNGGLGALPFLDCFDYAK